MAEKILALSSPDIQDIKVIKMPSKTDSLLVTASPVSEKLKKRVNAKEKKTKENNNSIFESTPINDGNTIMSKLKVTQKYDNKLVSSNVVIQNIPGIFLFSK